MKCKVIIMLILFPLTGFFAFQSNAQSLVIKTMDGTENVQQLSLLQYFSFTESDMLLQYMSGNNETYSVSSIKTLCFKDVPIGINKNVSDNNSELLLYPNPANNLIYIKNLPEGTFTFEIYRMDGVKMSAMEILSEEKVIDINSLDSGLYLLKINNQVLKFRKL